MQGKKHSEETKKLISEKSKGNKAFLGKKHTEEWKANRRKPRPDLQGRTPWNKGKGKFKTRKEKETNENLRKNFGIGIEEYNIMLAKQSCRCAVCGKTESRKLPNGISAKLSVDHDHKTGKIRGLLCCKCNFAIGHLDDNPYLCERAMHYLLSTNY